jgi:hypothetical protein
MCISLKMSVSEVKDIGYTNFGHPWKHKHEERTRQSAEYRVNHECKCMSMSYTTSSI